MFQCEIYTQYVTQKFVGKHHYFRPFLKLVFKKERIYLLCTIEVWILPIFDQSIVGFVVS